MTKIKEYNQVVASFGSISSPLLVNELQLRCLQYEIELETFLNYWGTFRDMILETIHAGKSPNIPENIITFFYDITSEDIQELFNVN